MAFATHRLFSLLRRPGPVALAALYSLDSAARALTLTTLALHAYEVYQNINREKAESLVSITYAGISVFSLAATLAAPAILYRFGLRRSSFLAIGISILGMSLLATGTIPGLLAGMLGRATNNILTSICLMVLTISTISKSDLVLSESLRLLMGSIVWGAGPILGVSLFAHFGIAGPAILTIVLNIALILFLYKMDLAKSDSNEKPPPLNPLHMIFRFMSQRQLRLAWLVAFFRSAWWSMFFTYPALYLATHGLATGWAGWLSGAGNMLLAISPLVRMAAIRLGLKVLIISGFWMSGLITASLLFVYDSPAFFAIVILIGAAFVTVIDAVGNIPFMRFAKRNERQQMTTIFRTYVELSDLLPSALYAGLLLVFDFRAVFVTAAILMVIGGLSATRLPRRL